MAISATHYALLKELHSQGVLPQGGRILEIGMANWYGDGELDELREDWTRWSRKRFPDKDPVNFDRNYSDAFRLARLAYMYLFDTVIQQGDVVSIDLDSAAVGALKLDLNKPIDLRQQFETVFNHGTMEHIANDQQVMVTMHDHCKVDGLMIHEAPYTGWHNHGFRNYQPTFFEDHAAANGYELVLMACEHLASRTYFKVESREQLDEMKRRGQLADNLMLFVVFRKTSDEPFKVPMQGVYAGALSEAGTRAWKELR